MKKLFAALILTAIVAPAICLLLMLAGCASIDKNADPLIVRAEQAEASTLATFDLVVNIDNANREFFDAHAPEFHRFAEWLREPIPPDNRQRGLTILSDLHAAKLAYKTNREAGRLQGYLAFVQSAAARATSLLSTATNLPAK